MGLLSFLGSSSGGQSSNGLLGAAAPQGGLLAANPYTMPKDTSSRLMLIGGALKDMGNPLGPQDGFTSAQDTLMKRQQYAQQLAMSQLNMGLLKNAMNGMGPDPSQGQPPPPPPAAPPQGATPQAPPAGGPGQPGSILPIGSFPGFTPPAPPPVAPPSASAAPMAQGGGSAGMSTQMRRTLATMALIGGHPDQAATILGNNFRAAGDQLYNTNTGELGARVPHPQYVNGQLVDPNLATAPKFVGEAPAKGAEMVYDAQGRPVGWHMADGSVQALNQNYMATGGTETQRHNMAEEAVARANAGSGAVSAGASATSAATGAANSGNVAPPAGFIIRRSK